MRVQRNCTVVCTHIPRFPRRLARFAKKDHHRQTVHILFLFSFTRPKYREEAFFRDTAPLSVNLAKAIDLSVNRVDSHLFFRFFLFRHWHTQYPSPILLITRTLPPPSPLAVALYVRTRTRRVYP